MNVIAYGDTPLNCPGHGLSAIAGPWSAGLRGLPYFSRTVKSNEVAVELDINQEFLEPSFANRTSSS